MLLAIKKLFNKQNEDENEPIHYIGDLITPTQRTTETNIAIMNHINEIKTELNTIKQRLETLQNIKQDIRTHGTHQGLSHPDDRTQK